jgi:two-component system sensor histidine kinase CiaH
MFSRIRRRLTMGYVGILALILVLFGVIVMVSFYRQVTITQDRLLLQTAQRKASNPSDDRGRYGRIKATTDFDVAVEEVSFDEMAGQDSLMEDILREEALLLREEILLEDADSPSATLGLPYFEMAQRAGQERGNIPETVEGPEGDVRVMNVPVYKSGQVIAVIQAAQSREAVWQTVNSLIFALVPVGVGALALAAVGGLLMSRRAMRPVRDSFERQRTFIAEASHELKTPLTLIRADAEVLSRSLAGTEEGSENRELAEDLLGETDRMNAVLSDLLLLARLDADKLSVSREPFNLAGVLAETAERFAARTANEGKRLKINHSGKLPARGDAARTGQILAALLDNALRFTPPGGLITVEGHTPGKRVEVTVTDTGPGIPADHLPHIFERFYRADEQSEARARSGGGTGLGLAIAHDLARAQDGELAAENAPNGGASFTLTLPAGP